MSGIKDINLSWFYRSLHERGETAETLAEEIASGRTHVTEVLNGTVDSPRTRRRLAPLLTEEERTLLGWAAAGRNVPHGTKSAGRHLETAGVGR